jgi:hypothetical protein
VDRRYLSSIILLQETAKSDEEAQRLKQLVFERINSGGVSLTPQESRNAIYNGPLNKMCIKLARNKYLCKLWDIPEPTEIEEMEDIPSPEALKNELYRNMGDVELVLRFFAYRQKARLQKGALKFYLDNYLKHGNLFPRSTLDLLRELFANTIQAAYQVLGKRAFWLWRKRANSWHWLSRPTLAVYDPMMFVLSKNLDKVSELVERKERVRTMIIPFYQNHYEVFEGRNVNPSIVLQREKAFQSLFDLALK